MRWFGWFRKNEEVKIELKKELKKRYKGYGFFGPSDEITEQEYLDYVLEKMEKRLIIITDEVNTNFKLLINLISKDYLIVPIEHLSANNPFIKPFNGRVDEDGDSEYISKEQVLNYAKKNKYEYITNIKGVGDLWIKD